MNNNLSPYSGMTLKTNRKSQPANFGKKPKYKKLTRRQAELRFNKNK
jgi:hypothetical protein